MKVKKKIEENKVKDYKIVWKKKLKNKEVSLKLEGKILPINFETFILVAQMWEKKHKIKENFQMQKKK